MSIEKTPQFPKMPWFPRDFASSTRGWPLVARGVYRELLDAQWDMGALPNDEEALRAIAVTSPTEWKTAWRYVEPKFPMTEGGRRNPRLEHHRAVLLRKYHAQRAGAQKTNASRRANGHADD
jgi:uncharacterized protein YdaU (DUF1376 family)